MKLLFCPHCQDVRKLRGPEPARATESNATYCYCGKSWGYYTDDINAVYGGDAVMLGISNPSLGAAIYNDKHEPETHPRPFAGPGLVGGYVFTAFIIPESAPSVQRERHWVKKEKS